MLLKLRDKIHRNESIGGLEALAGGHRTELKSQGPPLRLKPLVQLCWFYYLLFVVYSFFIFLSIYVRKSN